MAGCYRNWALNYLQYFFRYSIIDAASATRQGNKLIVELKFLMQGINFLLSQTLSSENTCWKILSCIPDKEIRVFYLDRQFLSHPCYLTQDRIKITCIKCIGCIESHLSTSASDVRFYNRYKIKNDVTLCILDVNVKNRTAVAGSVDFFKLE